MKIVYILLSLFLIVNVSAQSYTLSSEPGEVLSVSGTSSLHDWSVDATEMNDLLQELSMSDGKLTIDAFQISIPVASLDGGKGGMKSKLQKALKESEYPDIIFELQEQTVIDVADDETDSIEGLLTITDKSKTIDLDLNVSISNDVITLSGNEAMKMTDFDIDPPKALFGQIKTHDDIVVSFELSYKLVVEYN